MQILIFFRCNLKTHQISHAMFAVMFALIIVFWGDRMKAYWRKAIYMCPKVALNWTTSLVHMNFQMIFSVEQSRTIFTVVCIFTNTLFHVTRPAIVQDLLSTVLTSNCHVSSYVHLRFGPSCACHFTLFTRQHTIIMLFSYVHPQIFIRRSFKVTYDIEQHFGHNFVLLMMLFVCWIYWYFHTKMRTVSP